MDTALIFAVVVICSLSGANADCATDLQKTNEYNACFGRFGQWAAAAFGGSGSDGSNPDTDGSQTMAKMCTEDAKSKIGCFFKYIVQCPKILESMGASGAAFSIPGVDFATLVGDNPIETICATIPGGPCSEWMACFSETDPSQLTPDYGVTAQTYNMVPDHYKTFLSMAYIACGAMKPQMDCAMTKLKENDCPMEPFEVMAKNMLKTTPLAAMTFEENQMFMKDECTAVTGDFKTCVATSLGKPAFKDCYKNATDMYKTATARKSCAMYNANKDCLSAVQKYCGKSAFEWLLKQSPMIVDSGLPKDCEPTDGSTMVKASLGATLMVAIVSLFSIL